MEAIGRQMPLDCFASLAMTAPTRHCEARSAEAIQIVVHGVI